MRCVIAFVQCLAHAAAFHNRQDRREALHLSAAPPPTRRVATDDEAMLSLCDDSLSMGLRRDRLAYSNLGGHGPDLAWKDGLVVGNLFSEMSVDMGITVQGSYYPFNTTRNTVRGDMLVISLTPGTSVTLKVTFSDRMMNPVVMDKFMLTVGGFDMLPGGEGAKALSISGFKSFTVSDSSLVNITEMGDLTTFRTMAPGMLNTESMHALDLTDEERDRAVAFRFRNVSEFNFTLSTASGSQTREFFIGGQSNIVCPTRARCNTFTCPEYYNRKSNAEDTYCMGEECNINDDIFSCCYTAIPEQCMPTYTLMFPPNCVEYSNLGGLGPDFDRPQGVLYKNVFPESDENVDMIIRAKGEYNSSNSSNNGQYGAYGIVNLQQGNKVHLEFRFLDPVTGEERSVNAIHGYYFTIYDFDHQQDGNGREMVTVSGFADYTVSNSTTVEITTLPDKRTMFKSTVFGTEGDNPAEPTNLTQHDMDKTVSLMFNGTSINGFDLELEVTNGWSGRNFEFTGYSTLPCPNASLCTTYTCPSGWTRQSDAREKMCKTMPCTDDDLTTCCVPVREVHALCTTLVCPRYSVLRPEAHTIQCSSSECSSRDIDTCCIIENCDPSAQMNLTNVVHSNLGGQGPDSGEQAIIYADVFSGTDRHVDLHVTINDTVSSPSSDPSLNGKLGRLGVVNLQTNTSLTFTFKSHRTNTTMSSMHPYYFSILAFGRGTAHGVTARMRDVWGRMFLAESTMFDIDEIAGTISSSQSVRLHDLPTNAYAIDPRQQRYTVSTEIAAAQFTVDITLPSAGDFFFAGGSALGCPTLKSCLSYECPAGYRLKDTASEEVCQGEACTEDDLFVCCSCDEVTALEFKDESIIQNTLGDSDAEVEELLVSDVFPHLGSNVGLRITPRGKYSAHNASQNRLNGQFLQLNVRAGSTASFRFEFIDSQTREAFVAPAFFFSVFDVDQQRDGGAMESVSLSKVQYYRLSEATTLIDQDGWFRSSEAGSQSDNPAHPFALTADHLQRSVTFMVLAGASDFKLDVEIGGGWSSGRNVLFAGGSNLVCPERALCSTHTCPAGLTLVSSADRRVCAGAACTSTDSDECCEP